MSLRDPKGIVALLDHRSAFSIALHRGIMRYARDVGGWKIYTVANNPLWLNTADAAFGRKVDGAIGAISRAEEIEPYQRVRMPLVNVVEVPGIGIPYASVDNRAAGRMAAEFLLGRGLRRLAYLSMPDQLDDAPRREGFLAAAQAAGIHAESWNLPRIRKLSEFVSHGERLARWLSDAVFPLGILAFSDEYAGMVIEAARDLGLRIPDDIAVIGIDDDENLCECLVPQLSSVDTNLDRVGYEAARLLDQIMISGTSPKEAVLVEPRGVIERLSSDVLAIEDEDVERAVRFIRSRASDAITVAEVVEHVGISRRCLEYKFRQSLGRSPGDEIWRVRVELATTLLIDTKGGLADIAAASGFCSASHLSRMIKRTKGVTPSTYRHTSVTHP